jgi:hypothetical protein
VVLGNVTAARVLKQETAAVVLGNVTRRGGGSDMRDGRGGSRVIRRGGVSNIVERRPGGSGHHTIRPLPTGSVPFS